jgi:hypothetical protein
LITPEIKIQGRSGCLLEVITNETAYIVRKTSNSIEYNNRLKKQIQKQNNFKSLDPVITPTVLGSGINDNGLMYFEMPYIMGDKYSDYLVKADLNGINYFINTLLKWIDYNLSTSSTQPLDADLISVKLDELSNKLKTTYDGNSFIKNEFTYLSSNKLLGSISIGCCHGDLTLSNLIISNNKVYLIDFLDSFIESPLMDIIKIRQDTKHKWSLMLEEKMPNYQKNKLNQILNYIDNIITDHYKNFIVSNEVYTFFEKLNLLRILPYLTKKNEVEFIINSLKNT